MNKGFSMASNITTTRSRGNDYRYRVADHLGLARSIFGFDPIFEDRRSSKHVFSPTFEVKEQEDAFVILADVPGVKEEELDISLNANVLTISGVRQAAERTESDTYYLYERSYGSFSRSFTLPDEANSEAVDAHLAEGVLKLTIGKKAESKPRKISLQKS